MKNVTTGDTIEPLAKKLRKNGRSITLQQIIP